MKSYLYIFFIFSFAFLCNHSIDAQDSLLINPARITALEKQIQSTNDDKLKVQLLNEYGRLNFYNHNFKEGFIAVYNARELSRKLEFKGGEIMYQLSLAAFRPGGDIHEYHMQNAQTLSIQNNLQRYNNPPKTPKEYTVQLANLDSLLAPAIQHFKKIGDKEIQVLLHDPLADCFFNTNQPQKFEATVNFIIETCREINLIYPAINISGFKSYAINQGFIEGNTDEIHKDLLDLINKNKNDDQLGIIFYELGTHYQFAQKEYSTAVEYYKKSISYIEARKDTNLLIVVTGRISYMYEQLGLQAQRLNYLETLEPLYKAVKDSQNLYLNYQRLVWSHYNLQQYDKARSYIDILRQNFSTEHSLEIEALNSTFEAQVFIDKEDYLAAIPLLKDSYAKYNEYGNIWAPPHEAAHIAKCYIQLGNFNKALEYALIVEEWKNKYPERSRLNNETYTLLSDIYSALGQENKANEYMVGYYKIVKPVNLESSRMGVFEAEMRNILEKSQDEILSLEEEKNVTEQQNKLQRFWILSIAGALISAILILLILFKNNRHKKKANAVLQKQKLELEITLKKLKSTQTQLIHSEKMASLGELTAGIAHEIQNPLNFVNNFSDVSVELIHELKEEIKNNNAEEISEITSDLKGNLDKIKHHGQRASSIVKGMLEHSRTANPEKQLTDINNLADEYIRLAYHGLRAKNKSFNANFTSDLDKYLPKAKVIGQDLGRVLLNLFNNAFYSVAEKSKQTGNEYKPKVAVCTSKISDAEISISVKDNGNGIPKDVLDKIFQPFFTTKPTGQGTGLGLSLSYDIITKGHNGSLEVKSEQNIGTEFIIKIPIV